MSERSEGAYGRGRSEATGDPYAPESTPEGNVPGGQRQDMGERAAEYGHQAQERVSEYGERMRQQTEEGRERAASGMQGAAGAVRERTEGKGGFQEEAGTRVAEGMERTAGYLREHSTSEVWHDFENYAREHPMQAVAGAVVAGFVIGRILR